MSSTERVSLGTLWSLLLSLLAPVAAAQPPADLLDPELAAKFDNSVVGNWTYTRLISYASSTRVVTYLRFDSDGTYSIRREDGDSESGTYRVDGSRILMRPAGNASATYVVNWYFGTHPQYSANKGLILTSEVAWVVGSGGRSFTFDGRS